MNGNGTLRKAAADQYRASVASNEPLNARQLGEAFDRSRTWARSVIAEVTAADGSQDAASNEPVAATLPEMATSSEPEVPPWVGWLTTLAVLAVAMAAAVASVDHLATLARMAGTEGWRAWLLPCAVDGLATAAALTLYRGHKTHQDAGLLPWLALVAGLVASVAGNVAAVHPELVDVSTLKVAVGATPPLALALSVELALRQVRGT